MELLPKKKVARILPDLTKIFLGGRDKFQKKHRKKMKIVKNKNLWENASQLVQKGPEVIPIQNFLGLPELFLRDRSQI